MKSNLPLLRRTLLYSGQFMVLNLELTLESLKGIFLRDLIGSYKSLKGEF